MAMQVPVVIFLVFGVSAILRHCWFKTDLPASYRIQNSCIAFFMICGSAFGINFFIWCILHPSQIPDRFYVQSGIFPPLVALVVRVCSIFADFLMAVIGFEMVRQRRRARTLAIKFIPFFAIIGILETGDVSARGLRHPILLQVLPPIFIVLKVVIYFWIYRFFKDKRTEELMTNDGA
jgi:hypothetical protein